MSTQENDQELEALRYPVGRFTAPAEVTPAEREAAIAVIAELPQKLQEALEDLDEEQLNTPYRPGGWTVRMVSHHIADSHLNAFLRVRFALTADKPTIMPYNEDAWAHLYDDRNAPPAWSVQLLQALHARWVLLFRNLTEEQWKRSFIHPQHGLEITLAQVALTYAWHSRHHVAHITRLRSRMEW